MAKIKALGEYYENVEDFVLQLAKLHTDENQEYSEGYQRIRFYPKLLPLQSPMFIEEDGAQRPRATDFEYENKLADRILHARRSNILILIGGIGSGKSTTWHFVSKLLQERARKSFDSTSCSCGQCLRTPVLVDCLDVTRAPTPERTSNTILRRIRLRLYAQILGEWLATHNVSPRKAEEIDNEFLVLRRLLISNDLMTYYSPELDADLDLRIPKLKLERSLLAYPASLPLVQSMVDTYKQQAEEEIDHKLSKIGTNRELSIDFMAMLLKFFLATCRGESPLSFVVVDNLDQLPNRHITYLVNELFDISLQERRVPIIVPLRPSSISVRGFKGKPDYRYHWGPSNFELILKRLERRVLAKSRDEICRSWGGDRPDAIFHAKPTNDEVDVLLLATYLYANILVSGIEAEEEGLVGRDLRMHDDHRYFGQLQVPTGVFVDLSRTLSALVGTSSRYAIEEAQRYYENIYQDPGFLLSAIRKLGTDTVDIGIRRALPRLVHALISNEGGPEQAERRVNLFQPIRVTSNHDWPTIAPLRILHYLSIMKRATVKAVLARLRTYGVPSGIALDYLNILHEKERLLVWFSDNENLSYCHDSLTHDVVISEHGLAYYSDLLGDFEYCWHCASEVSQRSYQMAQLTFTDKLSEYRTLVGRVGETEIKQVAFRRCIAETLAEGEQTSEVRELFALSILYKGLHRILQSMAMALRYGSHSREYEEVLQRRLAEVVSLVMDWEGRYKQLWGSHGYVVQYKQEITDALGKLDQLMDAGLLRGEVEEILDGVASSWRAQLRPKKPSELVVETEARGLRASFHREVGSRLPRTSEFVEWLDKQDAGGIELSPLAGSLRRLFARRREVRDRLENTIPTFSEILEGLRGLERSSRGCLEHISLSSSVPRPVSRWCEREHSAAKEFIKQLESNSYTIGDLEEDFERGQGKGVEAMTEKKRRCNRILDTYLELGERLNVFSTSHLEFRWL